MSKLDELLRELCPDGVEYKRFDEVCTLNARIGWQRLTKAEYMPCGGRIPNRSIWILLGCADARFGIGRTGDCCLQRNDVS